MALDNFPLKHKSVIGVMEFCKPKNGIQGVSRALFEKKFEVLAFRIDLYIINKHSHFFISPSR